MAYSELVKNFGRIRDYMREFYVYGFRSRGEFTKKSARSYDDERRRVESWLGDYMRFRQTADGKRVFLSFDSRESRRNPLYRAWKAKSFTDGDITLHFLLFDILPAPEVSLTLNEIMEALDRRLSDFRVTFDESTVRKKLKEYASEGLIVPQKQGRTVFYRRSDDVRLCSSDLLDFFSEVAPCGVVGSYLLDRTEPSPSGGSFAFKHHYITGAMDSEILCALFRAMREKREITVGTVSRYRDRTIEHRAVPLRVMVSVQSGRQYLMAYTPRNRRIGSFRLDCIQSVRFGEVCERFDGLREELDGMKEHLWGVSTQSDSGARLEHVEFTIRYSEEEAFIPQRLEREKRCGTVEHPDRRTSRFSADVYDAGELVPWIRTFLCRITSLSFSDKRLEAQFREDVRAMYRLYGIGEEEGGDAP